ncbi:2-amino-4-hydroxy-6-hydroxymethyldihydropteridine diphosphokinase [Nitrosomonas sp.]|uniref:2-amino-4-hydroxy-6- hydroxymethyldihydropteridine diphosphokinase n=1 Tax=Nitrosomonas sp. TaxID=42353 RepID=UPI001D21D838|nr:2-amino-4-hydroxy-6-hydroxymethyldihydropteridine diphosphokinase [Nitrosomonas sp.]MCB1947784.1 2-amino-4-hydroxy-6-hydroxymethyldihydropteridine diphosphokinase [Nitrosomonas sp.]MCP5243518.1 2-amino-4-hydroxy-6-hydroxymethyldihydropteridine diphosphokinase [Burkholderiales bacterium]MDR4513549.1 2-amino-4-hydroxy-6-hydroxymethyldihydropteridine diphosphokinase [Nitrosomonas sp.]
MTSDTNECIIGIGSNINPEIHIESVLAILHREVIVKAVSAWVKTSPIGITSQNDFVNGAVKVQTPLSREAFKAYLKQLEHRLGRNRTLSKFGPRVIDLDIIVWNNEIVDEDYYTRDFVRNSVNELRTANNC